MPRDLSLSTRLIHSGETPRVQGAVSAPIFQTAMYESAGEDDYLAIPYIRLNNTPNHRVLHQKLASLEGTESALVTASGMAAISTTLLALLQHGEHLMASDCLYGGTHSLVTEDLPDYGIETALVDAGDPSSWADALTPQTRVFYIEAMTNPLLRIPAIEDVVRFAKEHGIITVMDATFGTPVNIQPHALGIDVVIHSATKYLNGHSDIVAGAIAGSAQLIGRIAHRLAHFGGSLDPHACFLLNRGLKTLAVRMAHHNTAASKIARFLEQHPGVERVSYPGLESHPDHARAQKWFAGGGGMIAFELAGGPAAADRLFERVQLPLIAPSLGGVESLLTRPSQTSHRGLSPEARASAGISDGLVRMSVGLEGPDDLIADLESALG